MALRVIEIGPIIAHTKGPISGIYWELGWDGIHCNPNVQGPYQPTPHPPAPPGWCLAN